MIFHFLRAPWQKSNHRFAWIQLGNNKRFKINVADSFFSFEDLIFQKITKNLQRNIKHKKRDIITMITAIKENLQTSITSSFFQYFSMKFGMYIPYIVLDFIVSLYSYQIWVVKSYMEKILFFTFFQLLGGCNPPLLTVFFLLAG